MGILVSGCSLAPKNVKFSKPIKDVLLIAREHTEFRILWNSQVQSEFTKLLRYPISSETHEALCRFEQYESLLKKQLLANSLPASLLAIAFVQTRFKNESGDVNSGIWHLNLDTALMYGLVVDSELGRDDRLDIEKSTLMALRYLKNSFELMNDWHLAILAYYWGENAVLKSMQSLNTRSAEDIEKAITSKKSFLSEVMAAIIVIQNYSCADNI